MKSEKKIIGLDFLGFRSLGVFVYLSLLTFVFSLPSAVFAQGGIVPCSGTDCTVQHLLDLFVGIYNWLLGLAAVVAVLMIVFAGVRMLLYYWSESPEQELTDAKHTLRRAIFGLIVIVTAYLVVATLVFTVLGLDAGGPVGTFLKGVGITPPAGGGN